MRNYMDEVSVAVGIIKHACSVCLNLENGSIDIFKDNNFDLQDEIVKELKTAFDGDMVVTFSGKSDTFASHRTWTVEVYEHNRHLELNSKFFGIGISLVENKDIVLSIIYLPFLDECYTATLGGGAYLNGHHISTRQVQLYDSVVAFGEFPKSDEKDDALQLEMIKNIRRDITDILMTGSNAINFAYVASGKLDGLVFFSNNVCSINPGLLLCNEAGAYVSNVDGGAYSSMDSNIVVAATPALLAAIKQSTTEPLEKGNHIDNKIKIGYLGVQGDLAEIAANEMANRKGFRYVEIIPCCGENQIVREMQMHKIDYAVVPVLTSDSRTYMTVLDQLNRIRYEVDDTFNVMMSLNLYKRTKNIPNSQISKVVTETNYYSFVDIKLRTLLPNVERIDCNIASMAAKDLKDDVYDENTAVICAPGAGEINRLALVAEDIVLDPTASIEFRLIHYKM